MLNDDSVFIPVDDAIVRFHNHLLSHERIVLSAKFGVNHQYSVRCGK